MSSTSVKSKCKAWLHKEMKFSYIIFHFILRILQNGKLIHLYFFKFYFIAFTKKRVLLKFKRFYNKKCW